MAPPRKGHKRNSRPKTSKTFEHVRSHVVFSHASKAWFEKHHSDFVAPVIGEHNSHHAANYSLDARERVAAYVIAAAETCPEFEIREHEVTMRGGKLFYEWLVLNYGLEKFKDFTLCVAIRKPSKEQFQRIKHGDEPIEECPHSEINKLAQEDVLFRGYGDKHYFGFYADENAYYEVIASLGPKGFPQRAIGEALPKSFMALCKRNPVYGQHYCDFDDDSDEDSEDYESHETIRKELQLPSSSTNVVTREEYRVFVNSIKSMSQCVNKCFSPLPAYLATIYMSVLDGRLFRKKEAFTNKDRHLHLIYKAVQLNDHFQRAISVNDGVIKPKFDLALLMDLCTHEDFIGKDGLSAHSSITAPESTANTSNETHGNSRNTIIKKLVTIAVQAKQTLDYITPAYAIYEQFGNDPYACLIVRALVAKALGPDWANMRYIYIPPRSEGHNLAEVIFIGIGQFVKLMHIVMFDIINLETSLPTMQQKGVKNIEIEHHASVIETLQTKGALIPVQVPAKQQIAAFRLSKNSHLRRMGEGRETVYGLPNFSEAVLNGIDAQYVKVVNQQRGQVDRDE